MIERVASTTKKKALSMCVFFVIVGHDSADLRAKQRGRLDGRDLSVCRAKTAKQQSMGLLASAECFLVVVFWKRNCCGDIFLEPCEERQFAEHRMVSQTPRWMVHRWRQGVSVCAWCEMDDVHCGSSPS